MNTTQNFTEETDRFGNKHVTYSSPHDVACNFSRHISNTERGKSVLFKNPSPDEIDAFNAEHPDDNILYQSDMTDNKPVYLYRNGSSCPELIDGEIHSAGCIILVKKGGKYYNVMCKDKTKSIITSIGGVSELKHHISHGSDMVKTSYMTACREVKEETSGTVMFGDKPRTIDGLTVLPENLTEFAICHFNSSYFGIDNIKDTYRMYGTYFDLDNSEADDFFDVLFDSANLSSDESYTLKYYENEETENVHAILMIPDNFQDHMFARPDLDIYQSGNDRKPFVSGMHHSIAYLYLAKELELSPDIKCLKTQVVEKSKSRVRITFCSEKAMF